MRCPASYYILHLSLLHCHFSYSCPLPLRWLQGLDPRSSRVAREEIFGPVVTIHPFSNEDHAVSLVNDSPYGLAGEWVHMRTQTVIV